MKRGGNRSGQGPSHLCEGPRDLMLGPGIRQNWDRKGVPGTAWNPPAHRGLMERRRSQGEDKTARTEAETLEERVGEACWAVAEDERHRWVGPAPTVSTAASRSFRPRSPVCHLMFAVKYLQICSHGNQGFKVTLTILFSQMCFSG